MANAEFGIQPESPLAHEVWLRHPRVSLNSLDVLQQYQSGQIPVCSIHVDEIYTKYGRKFLIAALGRSKNPNDSAYCRHGVERHGSLYFKIIRKITTYVKEGDYEVIRECTKFKGRQLEEAQFILRPRTSELANAFETPYVVFEGVITKASSIAKFEYKPIPSQSQFQAQYGFHLTTEVVSAYPKKKTH